MQRTTNKMATSQGAKVTQKYMPKLTTEQFKKYQATLKNYSKKITVKIYKTY